MAAFLRFALWLVFLFSDDWADNDDEEEEDGDEAQGTDSGEASSDTATATKKKKNGAKEAEKSIKKEHVNVVFIGHVGKLSLISVSCS